MRDTRNAEFLGSALEKLKELFPDKTAPERADMLENHFSAQTLLAVQYNGHEKLSSAG